MDELLLVGAAFSAFGAVVYTIVGRAVTRRPVSDPNQLANRLFALWWYALGGTSAAAAVLGLSAYGGNRDVDFFVAFTYVALLAIVIGLFGLLYYLLFLVSGKKWILMPLTLFYVAYAILLLYFVQSGHADQVVVGGATATLHYATLPNPIVAAIVGGLLILPPFFAAIALFSLVFFVRGREQRFRLATVSWSIIIWFGTSYAGSLGGLQVNLWWQVVTRLLGLGAAFAILLAYRPSRRIRAWLAEGGATVEKPDATPGPSERMASSDSQSTSRSTPAGTAW